jgi:hypothetical protein
MESKSVTLHPQHTYSSIVSMEADRSHVVCHWHHSLTEGTLTSRAQFDLSFPVCLFHTTTHQDTTGSANTTSI